MKLKIPYSLLPVKVLTKVSHYFLGLGEILENVFPFLKLSLKQTGSDLEPKEYLSMCIISTFFFFAFIFIFLFFILGTIGLENYVLIAITASVIFSLFVFLQQVMYPRIMIQKRVRDLERNLLPVLQNILVQLNSGVPLFDILVNISSSDYGAISEEFTRAVKEINAGRPQIDALEEMASKNPSLYFRRSVWQLVNGMKSGADMGGVIKEVIHSLSEEQVIQIQKYGGQLNPLAMFYMLVAIIAPSLGVTFVMVISSFVSPSETFTKMIFWGIFAFAVFFQIMFLGMIKSRRPNLLGG